MRLFLGEGDGAGMIACPACGLPLLLAAERRGRWVVGYNHLHLRNGRAAMLVCPDLDCHHREDVQIAGTSDDAVVYNSHHAAHLWSETDKQPFETLGERRERLMRIAELHQRTGNPKAPSAYRYWREQYRQTYGWIVPELKYALKSQVEVILEGKETSERGRVMDLLADSVLLDRTENHETVLVPLGSLRLVAHYHPAFFPSRKPRFDFHEGPSNRRENHPVSTPTRFAMVSGRRVILSEVSRFGKCLIETPSIEVAQALGLQLRVGDHYQAVVPAGLLDRCFKSVRWCHVRGHRLELHSATAKPGVLQLRTRSMETARALKMHRQWSQFHMVGRRERQQLRWWGYFHETEIERTEEKQVPLDISEMIRFAQIWHEKQEARAAQDEREWAAWEEEDEDDEE
ncbi:MAG TPA: hypothetical protein VD973_24965 [Symbiobacteriaceae bacterium]|jgi:hypothetical protein|nr:hypothetical protein [Symbiobacteriaceae bacterium]